MKINNSYPKILTDETLRETSISVITQNICFENTGYFCQKFKKLFLLTPSEYRRHEKK